MAFDAEYGSMLDKDGSLAAIWADVSHLNLSVHPPAPSQPNHPSELVSTRAFVYHFICEVPDGRWKVLRSDNDSVAIVTVMPTAHLMPDTTVSQLCQQLLTLAQPEHYDHGCRLPCDAATVNNSDGSVSLAAITPGRPWQPLTQALHSCLEADQVAEWLLQALKATSQAASHGWIQVLPSMDCFGLVDNRCCLDVGAAVLAQNDKYQSLQELDEGTAWMQAWLTETELQALPPSLQSAMVFLESHSITAIMAQSWFLALLDNDVVHLPSPAALVTPPSSPDSNVAAISPGFSPRALCKYSRRNMVCRTAQCQFLHLPGLKVSDADLDKLPPLPRPPANYNCHNCGSSEHYRADCPRPQRCKYTMHGHTCARAHCGFYHPPGTRNAPSASRVLSQKPPLGYVCHNCMDTTRSHFKANCPYPPASPTRVPFSYQGQASVAVRRPLLQNYPLSWMQYREGR
eukprot:TRINITY_DN10794_c0_g1_i1.p2 TRINITY_DN10794_c0_g1~~TRINITY_DN10794_c0_g1_i1.p2  ORF type:complete len:458 (+),score=61.09 TRINITY_DN10794_c0_g1_i1:3383-4756(+)